MGPPPPPPPCTRAEITPLGLRHDPQLVAVETRNRKRPEIDGIEPIVDRQQANTFPHQSFAQEYFLAPPAKPAAVLYAPHLQRAAIFRFRHARRIRSRRSRVHRTGCFHPQRFVRTLLVVFAPKSIEGPLLRPAIRCRRRCR